MWNRLRKRIKECLADLHFHVWIVVMSENDINPACSRHYFFFKRFAEKYYKLVRNADFAQDWCVNLYDEPVPFFYFNEIWE